MSTIEPTEEQKAAAREACRSLNGSLHHNVARLLAEREAKLREHYDASVAYYKAQADAYHLDVKTLHMHLDTARAHERTVKADLDNALAVNDELRARVAELEAKIADAVFSCPGCGRHDFGFFASQIKAACGPCRTRAEAAEAREAQHLADIKALMADVGSLLASFKLARGGAVQSSRWNPSVIKKMRINLSRLAHYDDAKAAEGGEG